MERDDVNSSGAGIVASLNLADVRQLELRGRMQDTGIWKLPTDRRVMALELGLQGDVQADPTVHGGARKAIYSYAREDYEYWDRELGRTLPPGTFGENLTVDAISTREAVIGEQWRVGGALLEVTQPRQPCWKLGRKMENPKFPRRFSEANRPGAYLAVVEPGEIGAGDAIEVVSRPGHPVTIAMLAGLIYNSPETASLVIQLLQIGLSDDEWSEVLAQA